MNLSDPEDKMNNRLIPISRKSDLEQHNIFTSPGVLRKWRHTGQYPKLFVKICNRLHIDLDEWDAMVARAKADRDERVARIERSEGK